MYAPGLTNLLFVWFKHSRSVPRFVFDEGMGGGGDGGSGTSMMRQVMERAMLTAVAAQMGLPEEDPSVREVFERESRLIGGGGSGGGDGRGVS